MKLVFSKFSNKQKYALNYLVKQDISGVELKVKHNGFG